VKILLIDTTQSELLVALVGDSTVEKRTHPEQRRHSEVLNTVASDFVRQADAFAVVTGPGSWTGSRVGVVAVKAWAMATQKPIIQLTMDNGQWTIDDVRRKFKNKDFTPIHELKPYYDSDFKITPKK